ncbi:transposase, partial [Porphyromonas gingivalis]
MNKKNIIIGSIIAVLAILLITSFLWNRDVRNKLRIAQHNVEAALDSIRRPLHGDWRVFCLLIHCIIGSYFVYLSIKNSIIFLPWHTNPR